MNTGQMPSVTYNKNVNGENKTMKLVDGADVSSQSASKARGGFMDLEDGVVNPMQPSNRDTFQ